MKKLMTFLVAFCLSIGTFAADKTWTGAAGGGDWGTGSNWNGGSAPINGDAVVFLLSTIATMDITGVPTITLSRLKCIRSGTNAARTLNLRGFTDGETITINQGSYATEGDVFVGDRCTLNLNYGGARVKLVLNPLAGMVCEYTSNEGKFFPAVYDPCDIGTGFLLKADANNHAELVQQNGSITKVTGWQEMRFTTNRYHLVSFPVISNKTGGTDDNCRKANCLCAFSGDNVRTWDYTAGQDWNAWLGNYPNCFHPDLDFEVGRGYDVYARVSSEIVFGDFNVGTYDLPTPEFADDWSLVGNPYPSGVKFTYQNGTGLIGWEWDLAELDTWVAYWNSSANAGAGAYYYYDFYAGGGTPVALPAQGPSNPTPDIIPRGQGFWIHSLVGAAGASTLRIKNEARKLATNKAIGKSAETGKNILYLDVQGVNGIVDNVAVQFTKDGSLSRGRDMIKRTVDDGRSELYTIKTDNIPLAVSNFPLANGEAAVALNLAVGTSGTHTITSSNFSSFGNNVGILLLDKKLNQTIDLRVQPSYVFTANIDDDAERFMLLFSNVLSVNDLGGSNARIYSYGKNIFIESSKPGSVVVYDMVGKELMNTNLSDNNFTKLNANFANGYYIVSVKSSEGVSTKKVYLN